MSINNKTLKKWNLYYKIRQLINDEIPVYVDPQEDREMQIPSMVLYSDAISATPLQLGGGNWISDDYTIDIVHNKHTYLDSYVATLIEGLLDAKIDFIDYSPIGGVSNFPYDPPDSTTINPNYDANRTLGIIEIMDVTGSDIPYTELGYEGVHRYSIGLTANTIYE